MHRRCTHMEAVATAAEARDGSNKGVNMVMEAMLTSADTTKRIRASKNIDYRRSCNNELERHAARCTNRHTRVYK